MILDAMGGEGFVFALFAIPVFLFVFALIIWSSFKIDKVVKSKRENNHSDNSKDDIYDRFG
ncbi:MAG: hypothetical protein MJ172_08110 [Clostridia bacterium]|nr:hypothetical protein [Clostridia bacterium]